MLNVIDEVTRKCLAIEVHSTNDTNDVARILDRLVAERGMAPGFVRFDNGPEFIAHAVADWSRFNGRFRDELLNGHHFDNLLAARVGIEDWRIDYNSNRPQAAQRLDQIPGPRHS